MRRALVGTVPNEILERRRKAYVSRGLVSSVKTESDRSRHDKRLLVEELGIVDSSALTASVRDAEQGREISIVPLLRTLTIEHWLRGMADEPSLGTFESLTSPLAVSPKSIESHELLGRERP